MSNFQATKFRTPVGRMVWGSLYDPRTEDFDGNPLVTKSGPDKGKPTVSYEFGLAIPKLPNETHWAFSPLGAIIWAQGHRDHPESAKREDFSWKVVDGDSKKPGKPFRGKPGRAPCDKEGFPGHWVFTFRGSNPPKVCNANGSAYLLEKDTVMPGDCIQVAGSVVGNEGASPGVYLNFDAVSFQGPHVDGRLSIGGIDIGAAGFGTDPKPTFVANMPTGQMAPPPPAAGNALPAFGSVPPPLNNPPPPPIQSAPQMVPQVPVTPSPGFIQPPPPPAAVGLPPPATGPVMTAKANGLSYAAFIANGWKDDALKANGYIA